MHFLMIAYFFFALISPGPGTEGFRACTEPARAELRIRRGAAAVKTITSDFVQEKHLGYLKAVITSRGKFWFIKPASLRWEYAEPYKYAVLINRGKVSVAGRGSKKAFNVGSNRSFRELNSLIADALDGAPAASGKYAVEYLENGESWLLRLTPKDRRAMAFLENIELYLSKSDCSVEKIRLAEPGGDYTLITLSGRKFNDPLPATLFRPE